MDEQAVTPAEDQELEQEVEAAEPAKPSKDLLDRTWDFFASVPVATVLIFVIAAASIGGSLIEQEGMYSSWETPDVFYPKRYGPVMGNFLFKTGMTRMYSSWWFLTLLFLLGASLVVCSLERFIPLWRAVQRPNVAPEDSFVKRLKNRFEYRTSKDGDPLAPLTGLLKARRYFVVQQGDRLYADKGRWGRWGPYITHIGLLLILVGAMGRAIPGFYSDQFIWVRDGAVVKVPGTDWFVQSKQFIMDTYENGQAKAYRTQAVVIENGVEVKEFEISMNKPLWHRWTELYQSSYKQELGKAVVSLVERESGKVIGSFDVDLYQPQPSYTIEGYKVNVREYFPDFGLDQNGKPVSRSSEVTNPGLVLEILTPDGKAYTQWYFVMYPEMEFDPNVPVRLDTADMGVASTTGLKVKHDYGIPVIYLGLIITSLGVFLTFYLAHRRYWALVDGGRVVVGGWTNRNQGSLRSEMTAMGHHLDPKANPESDIMEGEER